jgi:hypothetical protein
VASRFASQGKCKIHAPPKSYDVVWTLLRAYGPLLDSILEQLVRSMLERKHDTFFYYPNALSSLAVHTPKSNPPLFRAMMLWWKPVICINELNTYQL